MNDTPALLAPPQPIHERWQPLRLGLVELYHYDAQEFWFRDGRLLLRGNNGTGKSKVLSLTLPLLLDANLSPTRVEPDADRGKRMEWNLLMGKRYERRIGYTWIELGRLTATGPQFLTLGCGMYAVAGGAQLKNWFFLTEQRVAQDLWLVTPEHMALTRERLNEALAGHGRVFETARDYRRAVDERLFRIGAERYRALMDTLIQLRQPQLSKQPNEQALSSALTNALAPLRHAMLEDVADAMNQLEEYRAELFDQQAMLEAVETFYARYRAYAAVAARRQARTLRQAQTAYVNASRALNEANAALQAAEAAVEQQEAALTKLQARLDDAQTALQVLRESPEMRDAEALHRAERAADERGEEAASAERELGGARQSHNGEADQTTRRTEAAEHTRTALTSAVAAARDLADRAGLAEELTRSLAEIELPDGIELVSEAVPAQLRQTQQRALAKRREQIARIEQLLQRALEAVQIRDRRQDEQQDRLAGCEQLAEEIDAASAHARELTDRLLSQWQSVIAAARQLQFHDSAEGLEALAEWAEVCEGDNPMQALAADAERRARDALARQTSALEVRQEALAEERRGLEAERERLEAGEDRAPPVPHTRDEDVRKERPGAPLWRLVDFHEHVPERECAGIEAALEAAGMLDAWVLPAGHLLDRASEDVILTGGAALTEPLADWLRPAIDAGDAGAAHLGEGVVKTLLESIAGALDDPEQGASWISPAGRFRLGATQGAWHKPRAEYIGAGAREAARRRRLAELDTALTDLAEVQRKLDTQAGELTETRAALAAECHELPSDMPLREAHSRLAALEGQHRGALQRLTEAQDRLQRAESELQAARNTLHQDAADLRLPARAAELHEITRLVESYRELVTRLEHALLDHRRALGELRAQKSREEEARERLEASRERHERKAQAARQAAAERDTLRETVGADVEAIEHKLAAAEGRRRQLQAEEKTAQERMAAEREERGGARASANEARARLSERGEHRAQAVAGLNRFAGTGLLTIAVPDIEPDTSDWSSEPALQVARRVEQALTEVTADDDAWRRVQGSVSRDFTVLQQALSARGHQVMSELSDHGLIVRVIIQNRQERPDRLVQRLQADINQRRELLSAREREVIENHLQAEIAAELQRLIRGAEQHLESMNTELAKRPTSTGVKFKLEWQARPEGEGGAPTGLTEARRRLLRTVAAAWSPEDRRVVGEFLQNCIEAERAHADGGTLLEHLTNALDYRRWHQFRVKRWQDGSWRPLSGPASSGERALGLTVPLFAAAASHYSSASDTAPRLVLLDEAFAGIDDRARASCMGLMHQFDLDFVMTSEREWGCYAEVPGLSICQLVRHEGIDAVFVSPWSWDGRTRRREEDPTRRAAELAEA